MNGPRPFSTGADREMVAIGAGEAPALDPDIDARLLDFMARRQDSFADSNIS